MIAAFSSAVIVSSFSPVSLRSGQYYRRTPPERVIRGSGQLMQTRYAPRGETDTPPEPRDVGRLLERLDGRAVVQRHDRRLREPRRRGGGHLRPVLRRILPMPRDAGW